MIRLMENYIKSINANNFIFDWRFIDLQSKLLGLSGGATAQIISKCISFLDDKHVYLEVGIYQAANLAMVSYFNPKKICYGVDNFSQIFQENDNFSCSTEEVVQRRIKDFDLKNCFYFKDDFRNFLKTHKDINGKKVGIYFFDGPHALQDQIDGIEMSFNLLDDEAIIFIDDLASENVQESVKFLTKTYKELDLLGCLMWDGNTRERFNQGQAVLKYTRNVR